MTIEYEREPSIFVAFFFIFFPFSGLDNLAFDSDSQDPDCKVKPTTVSLSSLFNLSIKAACILHPAIEKSKAVNIQQLSMLGIVSKEFFDHLVHLKGVGTRP
ncbi:semaphorin-5A [Platysternon megacephalum]|uniref:Semaphorin-5A n=1 Tax=Platysternon megacephalum TaxID=55544 RepID=A0A4D9E326_9SAUR|nr:semaphorin-5A [Platysternon megacephalum]